jgi:hypothetical protein
MTNASVDNPAPGVVFCEPLGVYFPTLYRGWQKLTTKSIEEFGVADGPFEGPVFTTSTSDVFVDCTPLEPIVGIPDQDVDSIVIRWHRGPNRAAAYLEAVLDLGFPTTQVDPVCRTPEGIFTVTRVPTKKEWVGPLVIYVASYPSKTRPFESDYWEMSVHPDGSIHATEYL